MAAPEGWSNPLAALGPVSPHPVLSPTDSPLSSAPSSPQQYSGLREKCGRILREYQPAKLGDDTAQVLAAFLEHLSKDGQMTLMREMVEFNHEQLRQLREFLVHAILLPRKSASSSSNKMIRLLMHQGFSSEGGRWPFSKSSAISL